MQPDAVAARHEPTPLTVELTSARIAPPRRTELTRIEHHELHLQAVGLAAQFREFFPDVVKPSWCPFDHRVVPRPGTLAAFMQKNTTATA